MFKKSLFSFFSVKCDGKNGRPLIMNGVGEIAVVKFRVHNNPKFKTLVKSAFSDKLSEQLVNWGTAYVPNHGVVTMKNPRSFGKSATSKDSVVVWVSEPNFRKPQMIIAPQPFESKFSPSSSWIEKLNEVAEKLGVSVTSTDSGVSVDDGRFRILHNQFKSAWVVENNSLHDEDFVASIDGDWFSTADKAVKELVNVLAEVLAKREQDEARREVQQQILSGLTLKSKFGPQVSASKKGKDMTLPF